MASAGLDRLAHRAAVLLITGRSYRLARPGTRPAGSWLAPPGSPTPGELTPQDTGEDSAVG